MVDLGLAAGIRELWQENLLRDYTLVVEGREFQVHKVVLAAVSRYFKAMLGDGYMESKMDRVEVKGFSADIVSKLLEFLYTADENVIGGDALGILQCAMYLQMPLVADFCVKKMMRNIYIQNCLEILSSMIEYSFHEEVQELKDFIQRNWEKVMETFNQTVRSYDTLQILIEFKKVSEWDKFLCIKNWICIDYENHITCVDDLMSKVRFCVIRPDQLKSIRKMDIYRKTEGPWKGLVVNAVKYNELPTHLKVLDKSEQSEVRSQPLPAVFFVECNPGPRLDLFVLCEDKTWLKREQNGFEPVDLDSIAAFICLEIHNFLVVCRSFWEHQDWQIFDPRTLTWSTMPNMDKPKMYFAMVHHRDILYAVGGRYLVEDGDYDSYPEPASSEMEQYNFRTNSWSSGRQLPVDLFYPAACILGDTIYVCGGREPDIEDAPEQLRCLDLSSETSQWKNKASCLWWVGSKGRYEIGVLKRNGEEGMFIIDLCLKMQFYSPSTDQWSEIINTFKPANFPWLDGGMLFAKENSVYILNLSYLERGAVHASFLSWKTTVPEKGATVTKVNLENLPVHPHIETFAAILAIAP